MPLDAGDPPSSGGPPAGTRDLLASLVVFLVALPLCVGIAVACGVPPERGILTGIVGGLLVGLVAGSPLLVSGPAASLIVPVTDLIQAHGIQALGPVVMLAGLWQGVAGLIGLGQWFRAAAPAVITGMLIGIGVLITGSQLHVAIDGEPRSSFLENLTGLVSALQSRLASGVTLEAIAPLAVAVATVALLVGWNQMRPQRLHLVPGHLVSLLVVTLAVGLGGLPVRFLDLSESFFEGLAPVALPDLAILATSSVLGLSFVFAFVASAATLLTASAIDQRQTHSQTDYDRELLAQGAGNLIAGGLGGLPMTGVIIRSSVNVDAGARTRWSTVLHGAWLLGFVALAPGLLELIPRASLGAILVYTGYKLVDVATLRELYHRGAAELAVCLVTLLGVVFVGLFEGIVLGFGGAFIRLSYTLSRFRLRSVAGPGVGEHHLYLAGSATFLRIPELARAIEDVPSERTLHVHVEELQYLDQACLELLSNARASRDQDGRAGMVVEWQALVERQDPSYMDAGRESAAEGNIAALLKVLWRDYGRLRPKRRRVATEAVVALPADWVHVSRTRLRLEATSLEEVLGEFARLLSPTAGVSEEAVRRALRAPREDGHVALGMGVGLLHAGLAALERPRAALVSTAAPIEVEGEQLDVFFGLLAPAKDPRAHLQALALLSRVAHDRTFLSAFRDAGSQELALAAFEQAVANQPTPRARRPGGGEVLMVVDIQGDSQSESTLVELFRAGVVSTPRIASSAADMTETLAEVLGVPRDHRMLLVSTTAADAALLRQLIDESGHLLPDCAVRTHLLRRPVP